MAVSAMILQFLFITRGEDGMHPDYAGSLDHRLDELRDKRSSIRLFLYGTGAQSRIALRLLGEKDLTPDAYIVDDKYYSAETVNGIPVLKYSDYCGQQESRDNIWICIDNRDLALAVKERLKTDNVLIASFPIEAYRKDHYLDIRYYLDNKELFDQTRAMLADEESAVTFDEYVNACVTGDTSGLAEHNREKQYFNDITRGIDPSVFVDCGGTRLPGPLAGVCSPAHLEADSVGAQQVHDRQIGRAHV